MKLNSYQLNQILRTTTGYPIQPKPGQEPNEFLLEIADMGLVRMPCEYHNLFWIPDRVPIFSDIRRSLKSSILLGQLFDRSADTGLVVDALIPGKNAAHLLHLTDSLEECGRWVCGMNPEQVSITIKSIDETKLIVASLRSYVFQVSG